MVYGLGKTNTTKHCFNVPFNFSEHCQALFWNVGAKLGNFSLKEIGSQEGKANS